jgi:hypothetical protein
MAGDHSVGVDAVVGDKRGVRNGRAHLNQRHPRHCDRRPPLVAYPATSALTAQVHGFNVAIVCSVLVLWSGRSRSCGARTPIPGDQALMICS